MKLFPLKILVPASLVTLLALSGAYAAPTSGTYEITVGTEAVDGSAPPAVSYATTTGSLGQQWKWNGSKFTNVQSGASLADNGIGAPTENSTGDTFNLLVAGQGWNIVDARTGNYLGILNGALSFNMNQKSSWIFTSVGSVLAGPAGVFSIGAACTGSDCPAAQYHILANNVTLSNVSGICLRAVAGVANPYLMDGYGEWSQWSPNTSTFVAATSPGVSCASSPYSADGSTLTTIGTGTLVTAAGTWSLGTATCANANAALLNGTQAAGGCGKELLVANDGNVYVADYQGMWWQWSGSNWTFLNTTTQP